jgi:hypothetical protein
MVTWPDLRRHAASAKRVDGEGAIKPAMCGTPSIEHHLFVVRSKPAKLPYFNFPRAPSGFCLLSFGFGGAFFFAFLSSLGGALLFAFGFMSCSAPCAAGTMTA